jgi:hypothetical protein
VPVRRRKNPGVTKRIGGASSPTIDGLSTQQLRERVDVWQGDRSTITVEGRIDQFGKFARGTMSNGRPMTKKQWIARVVVYLLIASLTLPLFGSIVWLVTRW